MLFQWTNTMIIKLGVLFYYNIICKTNRRAWVAQWVGLPSNSYKPITNMTWVSYKKGCTRLAAASDKVYQLLAHGRWFSPGTLASSTTKTGCHGMAWYSWNIAKVALNTKNQSIKQAKRTWQSSHASYGNVTCSRHDIQSIDISIRHPQFYAIYFI